jgi:hypothetical protein
MSSFRTQQRAAATSGPSQQHAPSQSPPQGSGKVTEEQFQKMSARERFDYARQFPQQEFEAKR